MFEDWQTFKPYFSSQFTYFPYWVLQVTYFCDMASNMFISWGLVGQHSRCIPKIYSGARLTDSHFLLPEVTGPHKYIPQNETKMHPPLNVFWYNSKNASSVWSNIRVIVMAGSQSRRETVFTADRVCILTKQRPCLPVANSIARTWKLPV